MWISDRRRALFLFPIVVAAAAIGFECAAPPQCLRHSDCGDGESCISGTCGVGGPAGTPVEGGASAAGEGGASTSSSSGGDSAAATVDAAADAATEAADEDAGDDAGEEEPPPEVDAGSDAPED